MIDIAKTLADAVQRHRAADLAAAEHAYLEILRHDPAHADALHLLGVAQHQSGRHDAAMQSIRRAIATADDRPDFYGNLAAAALAAGHVDDAIDALRRLVEFRPQDAVARFRLGNALKSVRRFDEALALYRESIALSPELAEARFNYANTLRDLGQFDAAEVEYRRAVESEPRFVSAWNNLGTLLQQREQYEEARVCFETATCVQPDSADGWNNLGNVLRAQGNDAGAAAAFRRCLLVDPRHYAALCNLSRAEQDAGCLSAAESSLRQAVTVRPDDSRAWNSLGRVLMDDLRPHEAIDCFNKALAIRPGDVDPRCNRALAHLLLGDGERGWKEYEARWDRPDHQRPSFRQPLWDGTPLAGRTILLDWEQGLGDTLQFVRFASLLQAQSGQVIVRCQQPLARLLRHAVGIDRVVADGDPLPPFDVHAPLLSLPWLMKLNLHALPDCVPYISADAELTASWSARLAEADGLRIGVAWRGNAAYARDRFRSIPLAEFAPLAAVPGVRLIGLQKGELTDEEQTTIRRLSLIDLRDELDEQHGPFLDTAAVMRNLHLVITADTAIAHLAGALGVPACVALCRLPEWRWMLERDDSPWYPTMRLYRQSTLGEWADVFARIARDVDALLAHLSHSTAGRSREVAAK